jgi:hypothetical protein
VFVLDEFASLDVLSLSLPHPPWLQALMALFPWLERCQLCLVVAWLYRLRVECMAVILWPMEPRLAPFRAPLLVGPICNL